MGHLDIGRGSRLLPRLRGPRRPLRVALTVPALVGFAIASAADAQVRDSVVSPQVAHIVHDTAAPASSALLSTLRSLEPLPQAALPANLHATGHLQQVVERMWQQSSTFRRQCARLAHASVPVTLQMEIVENFRGVSRVEFERGQPTRADVRINMTYLRDVAELIAHELEHLLEIVDGIDLERQVERGAARRTGPHHYETQRAIEVGRRVAREVRDHGSAGQLEVATRGR